MALLDAGLAPERFQVDAVDISARALAGARRAVYGKNSFRSDDLGFRRRYFQSTPEGFVLDPAVRDRVCFSQANLLEPGFGTARGNYDFIFFRNLLIYLDPAARQKALEKIERMLAATGVLFVGPAEQSILLDHGFASANLASRSERPPRRLRVELPVTCPRGPRGLPPGPAQVLANSAGINLARPRAGGARRSLPDDLEYARRLVQAGQLTEAAAICEAHLAQSRTSAQAYFLLGMVREAGGAPNAIDYYRKALYLEPNHYESLMRMAFFAAQHGDPAGARNFRRRADRLKGNP
jgi:chemotaxis protein methyltransferase WspC